MKKLLTILSFVAAMVSTSASAHLIYFAYDDLGNGTVDVYGQHYHNSSEATGSGLRFTNAVNPAEFFNFAWTETLAQSSVDSFSGVFTQGWDLSTSSGHTDSASYHWLVVRGATLTNGIFNVSTIGATVVDTPWSTLPQVTVTGVTEVPEPSTLAVFALGLLGLAARRKKA